MKKPADPTVPIRLNLGGGFSHYEGFLTVDQLPTADVVHDITQPLPFPDNSVDELFASHVIEHFPMWQIQDLLQDWCRVLIPGTGLFWGFVPDIPEVAKRYLEAVEAKDWNTKRGCIANFNGGYTHNKYIGPGQAHYACYDADLLQETLYMGGFHPVQVVKQQAGPLDYRLVFVCGKGVYPVDKITDLGVYPKVPWRPDAGSDGGEE